MSFYNTLFLMDEEAQRLRKVLGRETWKISRDPRAIWGEIKDNEMVGWHHPLSGREFEQAPGVGDGQGGLACCSPWGCRVGHD